MLYLFFLRLKVYLMILNFIWIENGYFLIKILLCFVMFLIINFLWVLMNNVSKRDYYKNVEFRCRLDV